MTRAPSLFPWKMLISFGLCFAAYQWSGDYPSLSLLTSIFGFAALGYGIVAGWGLWKALGWLPVWFKLKRPTGIHGSAFKPTVRDAVEFGLRLDNPNGDGFPVAAKDGRILYYTGNSHMTCVGSNGAGKTASSAIPIGLSLGKHRSVVFTGKGMEVVDATASYRRDVLGQDVFINDAWGMGDGPSYCISPMGDLHAFVERQDPEALDIAAGKSQILIPEIKGDQRFFSEFAKPILASSMIFSVWNELDCGELSGNLPWLFDKFGGSEDELRHFFEEMSRCEIYSGSVKRSADRFLAMLNRSAKTAMSVLAEITNALSLFDPASTLGRNIVASDFDPALIKKKPISIYICIPPDKINTHGVYAGLVIDMLIGICMRAKSFEPRCTFVLDEFGNQSKGEIPSITPALYLGRSLGCQLITYVQDTSIFERYQEKSAFMTQAEVYMAWSIRDTRDAEELSKRSGNYTAIVENTNLPQDLNGDSQGQYSVGISEKSVPLYRPDEFLQMKDYTCALFFKQNPPIMADLVHYQSVRQWHAYAKSNPKITMDGVRIRYDVKP